MKKLITLAIALILAAFNGVQYIEIEEPVFTEQSYYKGNQGVLDFRQMYNAYYGSNVISAETCEKDPVYLEEGESVVTLGPHNFRWIYVGIDSNELLSLLDTTDGYVSLGATTGETLADNSEVVLTVDKDTKLVFPANAILSKGSAIPEGRYPLHQYTKGTRMTFIITDYIRNKGYRVTYGSMERWWCDLHKERPTDYFNENPSLPLYEHNVAFTDEELLVSGAVAGVAGLTSIPEAERDTTKAYVYVRFEETTLNDDGTVGDVFLPITIKQFYGLE